MNKPLEEFTEENEILFKAHKSCWRAGCFDTKSFNRYKGLVNEMRVLYDVREHDRIINLYDKVYSSESINKRSQDEK